jgi:hypothetical protein
MTIETTTPGIKTPSPSDLPPTAPTKAETAAMVAALPVKSQAAEPTVREAITQFLETEAAGVYHRNLIEGMRAQNRPVEAELRLFPGQPPEDVALYKHVSAGIIDAFLGFYLPSVQRAATEVIEAAQPYDGIDQLDPNAGRFLVSAAALSKLGAVLKRPAGDGKDRLTMQSIEKGRFQDRINLMLRQANEQLVAAGNQGEVKVVATMKLVAETGSFLRKLSGNVELKTGKLERWEFQADVASKDGALTFWTPADKSQHAKDESAKAAEKPRKPRAKKAEAANPAEAPEQQEPNDAPAADPAAATAA